MMTADVVVVVVVGTMGVNPCWVKLENLLFGAFLKGFMVHQLAYYKLYKSCKL